MTTFRPGTVVRYTPDPSRHDPRWCREGIAIAREDGRLVDTYWSSGSEAHVVTPAEMHSIVLQFHLEDFEELDRYRPDRQRWLSYAEEDRQRITMQHGHQVRLFIRKGALPDRSTMLANAREKVAEAESEVRSAESDLRRAQEDLAALLAAPYDCTCRPSLCDRDACPVCASRDGWQDCAALPTRLQGAPR